MSDYEQDGGKLIQEIRDLVEGQHARFMEIVDAVKEATK